MNNRLTLLWGVLAVQLVIAGILWLSSTAPATSDTFVDFDTMLVSKVTVRGDNAEVVLERHDDNWEVGGLPADRNKVADVVQKLAAVRAPWPVATSATGVARFEVGEDNFQRRVQLFAGERVVADVFLGTAPGYQRQHARRAGQDEVFSIKFTNLDVPVNADQWLDKSLVQPDGSVVSISRDGMWRLERTSPTLDWQVTTPQSSTPVPATDTATSVANRLQSLTVSGVAAADSSSGPSSGPSSGEDGTPKAAGGDRLIVGDSKGEYTLTFTGAGDRDYVVTSSRRDGRFKAAAYLVEQILVSADALLVADTPPDAESTESTESTESSEMSEVSEDSTMGEDAAVSADPPVGSPPGPVR